MHLRSVNLKLKLGLLLCVIVMVFLYAYWIPSRHQFKQIVKQYDRNETGGTGLCKRELRFLNESRPLVALASFQGAGNSWTRQLLESVTGIYTGSLYRDSSASFEGSKRCPVEGQVFIVKTHSSTPAISSGFCKSNDTFNKAIVIVRNPFDAILANYNRYKGGKVGCAKLRQFLSSGWKRHVRLQSVKWKEHLLFWLTEFNNTKHVLIYEELTANTAKEISEVLEFVQYPVNSKTLACLNGDRDQDKYHRSEKPGWMTKDNLYTKQLRDFVNDNIHVVSRSVKSSNLSKVIENYSLHFRKK